MAIGLALRVCASIGALLGTPTVGMATSPVAQRQDPAKDLYHDIVVDALKAEGWAITHDPLFLGYGGRTLYVDLGVVNETLAAEKNGVRLAVEIKSFVRPSPVEDLQEALGAYAMYRAVLADTDATCKLYMAVPLRAWQGIFAEPLGQLMLEKEQLRVIVYDLKTRSIVKWIN